MFQLHPKHGVAFFSTATEILYGSADRGSRCGLLARAAIHRASPARNSFNHRPVELGKKQEKVRKRGPIVGFGNAQPVNDGLYCDRCSERIVLPALLERIHDAKHKRQGNGGDVC
jgi:hypothetical protein